MARVIGPGQQTGERSKTVRADDPALPVVVTGMGSPLGWHLTRLLHRERHVIGIDRRTFRGLPKDVEHHRIEIHSAKARDVFRSNTVAAVVHLGVLNDPRASAADHHTSNVLGFQKVLEHVTHYSVPKLVLLSTATVYGPRPDNPQFLTEEAPLLGSVRDSGLRNLIEVDMLAQSFFWRRPDIETIILRPVHVLGMVQNAASDYLRLPRIPTLFGFDPMLQVIHEDDVVRAIRLALRPGVRGVFNLAGPPPLPLSKLAEMTGRPRLPLPPWMTELVVGSLRNLHLSSFPAPELDHLRYVCMVDDHRARDILKFSPQHDVRDAIDAVFDA